jgi:hypothetical protein
MARFPMRIRGGNPAVTQRRFESVHVLVSFCRGFRILSEREMMDLPGVNIVRRLLADAVALGGLLLLMVSVAPTAGAQAAASANDPSGMYTFLKEGEFVQLTVEDGKLSGFVSRFGDTESDKGDFIDQFFDKASLEGNHLSFKTKTVHAVWYEFDGTVSVEAGKKVGDEGYRVIRGKLTLHTSDAKGNDQAGEKTMEFKSFPDLRRP